jgi:hypothetical protein
MFYTAGPCFKPKARDELKKTSTIREEMRRKMLKNANLQ